MNEFFLKIINMSISGGWLVLAVLVLRLILKKAPKWINVLLWGIVAVRLVCPFSIESALSLIPSAEVISPTVLVETPAINTGFPIINNAINPMIQESVTTIAPEKGINTLKLLIQIISHIWLVGVVLLLAYTAISYLRLRRNVDTAVLYKDNIYQSEHVDTPFVLGILKPKIYLPFRLDGQELEHVVAHECAHIRRRDHWWKPLGFLLLTIHWFNPLMWIAYVLLCRDIELACDEKVVRTLGNEQRADYTQALVACSVSRRSIAACPLAFGEVGVKERVKSVMNYRKPAFWVMALAVIACAVVAVCFLTDPPNSIQNPWTQEYVPGTGNILGNVDKERFERISTDFAIGADRYGRAVFKDPYQAFDTFVRLYADGIAAIRDAHDLRPISPTDYDLYKKYGWQLTEGTPEVLEQASFVSRFLDIYENSFSDSIPDPSTEPTTTSPYRFEAEILEIHDGYFLVAPMYGSMELSSADRLAVPMQNMDPALEPEVGDIIVIEHSGVILETYPAQLSEVYRISVAKESHPLSLNDVILLSRQGEALSWSDFEPYDYIETGSGLYIRVYVIDDLFQLWIGGSDTDTDPMYIYLSLANDLDTKIDIRTDDVKEFIFTHTSQSPETWDLIPMVMVNGTLYLDTGCNDTQVERTDHFDGEITSSVEGWQKPTQNDQSNFGTGYGYQYGETDRTVELYMDGVWRIFATEEMRQEIQFPDSEVPGAVTHIVDIIDRAEEEGLPCDDAEEKFYEDEMAEYYFSVIKSHYVLVLYSNSSTEDIVTALNAGRASISDLDAYGITYHTVPKN